MILPLLILCPHASGHVPADILRQMLGENFFDSTTRANHLAYLFNEGDPFTDLIFHLPNAHFLPATVSRFVVDLNRYRHDQSANGVIKTADFSHKALYPEQFTLTSDERETRLRRYFDSFHTEIERLIASYDIKLIIDGHSMTSHGPSLGPDAGQARPALTLMTGAGPDGQIKPGLRPSISSSQAIALKKLAEQHFHDVLVDASIAPVIALNEPWDMDELCEAYADPKRKRPVAGFGLEINRALYLNTHNKPQDDKIKALHQAFSSFALEALTLFEDTITSEVEL